jgi:hypothetical protein
VALASVWQAVSGGGDVSTDAEVGMASGVTESRVGGRIFYLTSHKIYVGIPHAP